MRRQPKGFGPFQNRILTGLHFVIALATLSWAPVIRSQSNPPALTIAPAPEGVTVSWPLSGYYSVLETTTNLSNSAPWVGIATAARVAAVVTSPEFTGYLSPAFTLGDTNSAVIMATTNDQRYFRLAPASFIPAFGFAIFYDGLLEFTSCASWTVNGPVHANGDIYTGSGSQVRFAEAVTTSAAITSPANNGDGPAWAYTGAYLGSPSNITYVPPLLASIGTTNTHTLIEMPVPGVPPTGQTHLNDF